jgi:uncharacterized protein with HEPN domain
MRDPKIYIIHSRDCIARIEAYIVEGKTTFFEDLKTQDAVIRNLEVMCDSVSKIPDAWKAAHPETDWVKIVDFRNVLAHQYLSLDIDTVWDILENYLPNLKQTIELIAQEFWH